MLKNASGTERTRETILLVLLALAVAGFVAYLAYTVNNKSIFVETTVGILAFAWLGAVVALSLAHSNARNRNKKP
jgi:uncharacterized membrane protein YeiH